MSKISKRDLIIQETVKVVNTEKVKSCHKDILSLPYYLIIDACANLLTNREGLDLSDDPDEWTNEQIMPDDYEFLRNITPDQIDEMYEAFVDPTFGKAHLNPQLLYKICQKSCEIYEDRLMGRTTL